MITAIVQVALVAGALTLFVIMVRDAHERGKARLRRAYPRVDPAPAVRHLREHRDFLRGVNR